MLLALPDVPLRTASFGLEDRWLLWSRLELYPDRLELSGWSFTGPYHRRISLADLERVDHTDRTLLLYCGKEEPLSILVDDPEHWATFIHTNQKVSNAQ